MTTSRYEPQPEWVRQTQAELRAEDAAHDQHEGQRQPSVSIPRGDPGDPYGWARAFAKARGELPDQAA